MNRLVPTGAQTVVQDPTPTLVLRLAGVEAPTPTLVLRTRSSSKESQEFVQMMSRARCFSSREKEALLKWAERIADYSPEAAALAFAELLKVANGQGKIFEKRLLEFLEKSLPPYSRCFPLLGAGENRGAAPTDDPLPLFLPRR